MDIFWSFLWIPCQPYRYKLLFDLYCQEDPSSMHAGDLKKFCYNIYVDLVS